MPQESSPTTSIRVRILDCEYPLRVAPGDEEYTQHLAKKLDQRLRQIRESIPGHPDLTHAVVGALGLTEDLYSARADRDRLKAYVEVEAAALSTMLDEVLQTE